MASSKNRRRYPRVKTKPEFRIKARLNKLGEKEVHYFEVENLSMGGAGLASSKGAELDLRHGDNLEVLFIGKEVSLRCVTKVVQSENGANLQFDGNRLKKVGLQIVGIDEKSRKVLADFLQKIETKRSPITIEDPTKTS